MQLQFLQDIDCMPLNPYDNMPALFGRHTVPSDRLFENLNDLKVNGLPREYIKLSPHDHLDNVDGISQLSPLANPASLKQTKACTSLPSFTHTHTEYLFFVKQVLFVLGNLGIIDYTSISTTKTSYSKDMREYII